ncbi:hypothetical protein MAR_020494 [Mya arenaria]|uniref:Uncharacterized protein n=1 Tax=Mya arenaria TaxID=6604 RepID=A0ABY7E828_MYAAR|nr:hypothetical protein MAR_020494 [Mya arenaria]
MEEHHDKLAVELGLTHLISSPMCNITKLLQEPENKSINSSKPLFQDSCVRSWAGYYMACCVYTKELDRFIWASFTFDPCGYRIKIELENIEYELNILDYNWGTRHDLSMKGVWSMRFLIHNVQSKNEFTLDVDIRLCFEDAFCDETVPLAVDLRIPYTNCTNASSESGNHPYQDLSYDFWHLDECKGATTSSGCQSITLPNETQGLCLLDDNCRGFSCCPTVSLGDVTRNVRFYVKANCKGSVLSYGIERKFWEANIENKPAYLQQHMKNAIALAIEVRQDSPTKIKVSVNFTLCVKEYDAIDCATIQYFIDQQLDISCSDSKRRKRSLLPNEFSVDAMKHQLQQYLASGSANEDIQSFIDAFQHAAKTVKQGNLQPEEFEELESTIKQAMKSLGWNNPDTIKHQPVPSEEFKISYEIEGAEKVVAMFDDISDTVNRANQLFVVGKGLSKLGTELLGTQLANMTIADIESLLHTKKVDPFKIRNVVKDFIDLAKALYSEVMEKISSGNVKNIFDSFEFTLKGSFNFPRKTIRFFDEPLRAVIPLGGILDLTLEFDAWGYYGLDVGWQAKIIGRSAGATVIPYGGLSTYFEVGIGNILYGILRLEGQLCNIQFPTGAEIGFSKFPLDVGYVETQNIIHVLVSCVNAE